MRTYLMVGVAALVLAVGAYVIGDLRADARWEGRVEAIMDLHEADSLRWVAARDSAARRAAAFRDSAAAAKQRQDSAEAELAAVQVRSRRDRARFDEIMAGAEMPDTVRDAINVAIETVSEEARVCSMALLECNAVTANLRGELEAEQGRVDAAERRIVQLEDTNRALVEAGAASASPLPWVIAAVATAVTVLVVAF